MSLIGLQLIVYGGRPQEDFAGVLAEVREAGYDGVETGVLYPTLGAGEIVRALQDQNLALAGMHTGYGDVADETRVREHIAFLKEAGSRFLICSGVADNNAARGYEEAAETFNRVGESCRDAGLTFCYHNHAWEFKPLENGQRGIDILLARTDPALVKLCIDVYWVHIGGEKPAAFIAQNAARAGYYHFKDGRQTPEGPTFIELGQGAVDLVRAKEEALKHPLDWIICEQDRSVKEPKISITESRAYLRTIGL